MRKGEKVFFFFFYMFEMPSLFLIFEQSYARVYMLYYLFSQQFENTVQLS